MYTTHKAGEDFEIHRNKEHVATYDPNTDDVTYLNGCDRFAGPIGRQVTKLRRDVPETPETSEVSSEQPTAEEVAELIEEANSLNEPPVREISATVAQVEEMIQRSISLEISDDALRLAEEVAILKRDKTKDRKYIHSLEIEIRDLKAKLNGEKVTRTVERYKDFVDMTEAPERGPKGDLDEGFLEWARTVGMTEEVWNRRYHRRLKGDAFEYKGPGPKL